LSNPPDWRTGKVNDLASGVAEMLVALVKESRDAIPSCLNCAYSQIGNDQSGDTRLWCSGHKAYPPPHVIVHACGQYVDKDQIPF
jgi:hypothetical protein